MKGTKCSSSAFHSLGPLKILFSKQRKIVVSEMCYNYRDLGEPFMSAEYRGRIYSLKLLLKNHISKLSNQILYHPLQTPTCIRWLPPTHLLPNPKKKRKKKVDNRNTEYKNTWVFVPLWMGSNRRVAVLQKRSGNTVGHKCESAMSCCDKGKPHILVHKKRFCF